MGTPAELSADEIRVWSAAVDVSARALERLWATLAEDERERASRFAQDGDRRRFIARRGFRRFVLARYVGCEPAAVRFTRAPSGKPGLDDGELCFSCSHSRGLALVAVTRGRRVGVDVECVRPVRDASAIAESLFAERERASVVATRPARRDHRFLSIWTRKEALVKGTGEGLRRALDSFEATGRGTPAGWSLVDLAPTPEHVGAVAAEGTGWRVRYHEL